MKPTNIMCTKCMYSATLLTSANSNKTLPHVCKECFALAPPKPRKR